MRKVFWFAAACVLVIGCNPQPSEIDKARIAAEIASIRRCQELGGITVFAGFTGKLQDCRLPSAIRN